MTMTIPEQQANLRSLIKNVTFKRKLFGVDEDDVRACIDKINATHADIFARFRAERDASQRAGEAAAITLWSQNAELTRELQRQEELNGKLSRQLAEREENSAETALRRELLARIEALESQRRVYAQRADLLFALLAQQKKAQEDITLAAQAEADKIIAAAEREAEAILLAAHAKARRHTEDEEITMQAITKKGREVQCALSELRKQAGALSRKLDGLQERAGELKMLRALREQDEELGQELDRLQEQAESVTDRGGYEPPLAACTQSADTELAGIRAGGKADSYTANESQNAAKAANDKETPTAADAINNGKTPITAKAVRDGETPDATEAVKAEIAPDTAEPVNDEDEQTDARAAELTDKLARAAELLGRRLRGGYLA